MAGLDFIVFGVGRSGTTAVAHYLNSIERIHCGIELFPPYLDHRKLVVPDSFLDGPIVPNTSVNGRVSYQSVLQNGNKIKCYGNKTPDYYYRLEGVMSEIGQPKAILCYRDIAKVAQSYSMRAQKVKDGWPRGRTGLFAFLDLALLMMSLNSVNSESIFVIPHMALKKDWLKTISSAALFLDGGHPPDFDADKIAIINSTKRRTEKTKKPKLNPLELKLLKIFDQAKIDSIFIQDQTFMLSEKKELIHRAVQDLNNGLLAEAIELVSRVENEEVKKSLRQWHRHFLKVS